MTTDKLAGGMRETFTFVGAHAHELAQGMRRECMRRE
jgi:hypothetical protein